ncbi:transketolase [Glaciimonas sp. Gout2]|uniref:transketolase n=1 Tax=unclassified Glaciimonas TaxID=2644401 RepID=UPI002B2266FD|nr:MULTISPECIES: transketolase [unclassified Glaciimonas]MEB0011676.1 transketolase [Glaciimonas sp. Cout2]MEB0081473.1 transketolase [Glaciimonas sp. Gout2]
MNAPEKLAVTTATPADALRFLAADAVEKAKSGHPGAPMGMAEIADVLWRRHLRHNPADPKWLNRDRFVLSNGHGSMLLYALLHLTGYDLPIEELKQFRQMHAKTPGHPEVDVTPGVETTTGPLGQGLSNAVGMALAEKMLAANFNRPGHAIIDHHTYVFVGDGCLMEGISHEVSSLAGTLGLGKLICFYDDNGISIDGNVKGWFADDTPKRFAAYGWNVIAAVDGHDVEALDRAIRQAKSQSSQPTLICCKTIIGMGAPNKAGGHDVHGAPLGAVEIAAMRAAKGWTAAPFEIPDEMATAWDARTAGQARQAEWNVQFAQYQAEHPALASELNRRIAGTLPADLGAVFDRLINTQGELHKKIATRKASQIVLEAISATLPEFFGGSADLTGSNLTNVKASVWVNHQSDGIGNYLSYGVREFGMAAMMNGMALYGGFIPYGGTFMTFSDYSRNAIRMAALMKQRVIHVLTHDSIGLGEDGPTHQPIEHAASLRLIPNNRLWRPCDGVETAVAWQAAIIRTDGPTCLIFSRQALTPFVRNATQIGDISRGGYILSESLADLKAPQVVLIATGSEVEIAAAAAMRLSQDGIAVRVVSMPCVEVFYAQDSGYQKSVLPDGIPRVSIEAGITWFWRAVVGEGGIAMGIDTFGESAPAEQLYDHFKLTAERMVDCAMSVMRST